MQSASICVCVQPYNTTKVIHLPHMFQQILFILPPEAILDFKGYEQPFSSVKDKSSTKKETAHVKDRKSPVFSILSLSFLRSPLYLFSPFLSFPFFFLSAFVFPCHLFVFNTRQPL